MIKEDRVKEKIKRRTNGQKCELYTTRAVTFTINLVIVGACWTAIYLVITEEETITVWLEDKADWLSYVAGFIPSLCLAFINLILPMMTNLLIACERWDFKSTVIIHEIFRNFLAKQFNVVIFFLLNFDMLVSEQIFQRDEVMRFKAETYACPELQISINFLRLVATEVFIFLVKHPLRFLAYKLKLCLKRAICG
jgi:hypothetical protein